MNELTEEELRELDKDPLKVILVGPANVGKTSLTRTLSDKIDFGVVADVGMIGQQVLAASVLEGDYRVLQIFDTPGFQNIGEPRKELGTQPTLANVIRYFTNRSKCAKNSEQDAASRDARRVFEHIASADIAMYVVKPSEPPLGDHDEQLFLLRVLGLPVVVIMNIFRNERECHRKEWDECLKKEALLNNVYELDARLFDPKDEEMIYAFLAKRLKFGTLKERLALHLQARAVRKRENRLNETAALLRDELDDLAGLKLTRSDVDKKDAANVQDELNNELIKNTIDNCRVTDNALKAIFKFAPGSRFRDPKLNEHLSGSGNSNQSAHWLGKHTKWYAAPIVSVGVLIDVLAAGTLLGGATAFAIALATAISIGYDEKSRTVTGKPTDEMMEAVVERKLRFLQRMYFTGAAGLTDGTPENTPIEIKPGSFCLSKDNKTTLKDIFNKAIAKPKNVEVRRELLAEIRKVVGLAVEQRPEDER